MARAMVSFLYVATVINVGLNYQVVEEPRAINNKQTNPVESMTIERAFNVVQSYGESVSLIQMDLMKHKLRKRNGRLRSQAANELAPEFGKLPDAGTSDSNYTSGVNGALARVNEMRLAAMQKRDFETLRCKAWKEGQDSLIEEVRQDRQLVEGMLGDAQAERVRSEGTVKESSAKVEKLDEDLELHSKQCETELKDLQGQLVLAKSDLEVMFGILDASQCKPSLLQIPGSEHAEFLQCENAGTGERYTRLKLKNKPLQAKFEQMQHPKSRRFVASQMHQFSTTADLPDVVVSPEKCTISGTASCPVLREKLLDMQAALENSVVEIEHMVRNSKTGCEATTSLLKAEKSHHVDVGRREGTVFLQASEDVSEYEVQKKQKETLEAEAMKEMSSEMEKCRVLLDQLKEEHCALDKIRGELVKMYSVQGDVQDCQVSPWEEGECSMTCGGGTRYLSRRVVVPAAGGSICPALSAKQPCNQQRCPQDCILGDWSKWGPCSAFCNGGVRGRVRPFRQRGTKGGQPCGESSVTEACNMQACDADCELHAWTDWTSTCSKACGGGEVRRFRNIKTPPIGSGTCPDFHSAQRLATRACNTQQCTHPVVGDTEQLFECDAKLDIVLLLDGSGSLGQANYDLVKKAAAELTSAMGPNVNIGALVFSGPSWSRTEHPATWLNWHMCTGNASWDAEALSKNPAEICGMKWVSHLSPDTASVKTSIEAAAYPGFHTFTHMALYMAGQELKMGRQDAHSVIVTITDGEPTSIQATRAVVGHLKDWVRLMWVPVGMHGGQQKFAGLASDPASQNIISIENITEISAVPTVNRIIEGFCPNPH